MILRTKKNVEKRFTISLQEETNPVHLIQKLEVESWQLDFFLVRLKHFATHPCSFFSLRRVGRRSLIISSMLVSLPPGLNRLVRWTMDRGEVKIPLLQSFCTRCHGSLTVVFLVGVVLIFLGRVQKAAR